MGSCEGGCGGEKCCRYKGLPRPVNLNSAPGNSFLLFADAEMGSPSSHIVSSTPCLFQSQCRPDGDRVYRHSQGPRHGGGDFQAVRPHPAQCYAAHRSVLPRELKRRQKQREKEARRVENSANRPPAPNRDGATDEVANEEDLSPNVRWSYRYMHYDTLMLVFCTRC
jgi:hypothetical protein